MQFIFQSATDGKHLSFQSFESKNVGHDFQLVIS